MMRSNESLPDLPTVIAIALLAYALSNVAHEAIGHGGMCIRAGGQPLVLSSVHFECGDEALSVGGRRAVAAAGTIVNFIAGAIAFIAFRKTDPRRNGHLAYFLWLFTTLNLLMGAGYFLFSGLGNIGDWAAVARDAAPPVVWRPLMAAFGGALYFLLARRCARWLRALIGDDDRSMARAKRLAVPAYIAGGILFCVAGLFNPVGPVLIAISAAAASFGGASGLLWLTQFTRGGTQTREPAEIGRSYAWIASGMVVALVFVFILGPGLRF